MLAGQESQAQPAGAPVAELGDGEPVDPQRRVELGTLHPADTPS